MLLEITDLHKSFGKNKILQGIDLSVDKGQVIGIIGSSGSGKSTLLRCINFLEEPQSGFYDFADVSFDVKAVTKSDIQYMRRHTAMVFQQFNLFKYKTALENVMEGPLTVQKQDKVEAREAAENYLSLVGLTDRMNYYPRHLSGGQQQRVALARALALHPKLILLDEPTSALDPEMVGEVLGVIKTMTEMGNTLIIVSHEMNFINEISDHVLFMDEGVIREEGPPNKVFGNPQLERTRQFLRRANVYTDYLI